MEPLQMNLFHASNRRADDWQTTKNEQGNTKVNTEHNNSRKS